MNEQTQEYNNNIIQSMTQALRNLEATPKILQSPEYQEIYNKIQQFIEKTCIHQIVHDSIDTCTDCSKTIRYCIKCEKTFD